MPTFAVLERLRAIRLKHKPKPSTRDSRLSCTTCVWVALHAEGGASLRTSTGNPDSHAAITSRGPSGCEA